MKSTWSIASLVVASAMSLALGVVGGRTALNWIFDVNTPIPSVAADLVVDDKILSAIEANDIEKAISSLGDHIRSNAISVKVIRGDGSSELEGVLKRREALINSKEDDSQSDELGKCGKQDLATVYGEPMHQLENIKGSAS